MTSTLLTYSLGLLVTLSCLYSFIQGLIRKTLSKKEAEQTVLGGLWILLALITISCGYTIAESGKTVINTPKDLYSETFLEEDSTVSDQTLYEYMEMMRIPHKEVVLMQAKLESANYSSGIFKRSNNLFGMKVPRTRVTVAESGRNGYAEYRSWKESVNDYALWQFSHNIGKLSEEEYLQYLGKIYAEDPSYVQKVKGMIENYDFKHFKEKE